MQVKVLFFGVLTEITGTVIKHYSDVRNSNELISLIEADYPSIVHHNYRIALNNEFISGEVMLSNEDEIALMPPFAGG